MAKVAHYTTQLTEGNFYHIYNRAVGSDLLFKTEDNYQYFLKKYHEYINDYADTYAYCLLGNHFHLLIRVKDELPRPSPDLTSFENLSNLNSHQIISKQFKNLFIAYSKAFNKQQNRNGTLFQTPFKRCLVDNDIYFTRLIYYIHANPQTHGICNDFAEYKWSSYGSILSDKISNLKRQEVMDWFYGKNEFINFHKENQKLSEIEQFMIE
jgi:putative transposase